MITSNSLNPDLKAEHSGEYSSALKRLASIFCMRSHDLTLSRAEESLASAADSLAKLNVIEIAFNTWQESKLFDRSVGRDQKVTQAFFTALSLQAGTIFNPKPEAPTAQRLADGLSACLEIQISITEHVQQADNQDDLIVFGCALYYLIACGKPLQGAHTRGLQLCTELVETNQLHKLRKLTEILTNYAQYHGLSTDTLKGIRDNILPAIEGAEPGSKPLWGSRTKWGSVENIWGCFKGEFGLAQFVCHCYCAPVTPERLNELIMASRRMPTSDLFRLEQNRRDGLALKDLAIRDAIHDQAPCIHELLQAMVNLYDNRSDPEPRERVSRYCALLTDRHEYRINTDRLLDLSKYDEIIPNRAPLGELPKEQPAIEILRRVADNSRPSSQSPPESGVAGLDFALESLHAVQSNTRDKRAVVLSQALDVANTHLEELISAATFGIDPRMIPALSWLDNETARHIREMDYEEQCGAYKISWFRNAVIFCGLTGSATAPHSKVLLNLFETLDSGIASEEAYQAVSSQLLEGIVDLVSFYRQQDREHWCEML